MTYEEFQAGLAETPELINEIYEKHEADYTKHLTEGKKMIVTTPDAIAKEYAKLSEPAIKLATKQTHEGYETKLEKISGVKKLDGESGHAYLDRLSAKLKYLENNDEENSPLYKGLKKELDDLKTERTNEKQAAAQARIDNEVEKAVSKLKFALPAHLKKDDEKTAYQKRETEDATDVFSARYTTSLDDKGRILFTNKKGEAQTVNGEPMTAEAIFARDFATKLVPTSHSQGGAGGNNDDPQKQQGDQDFLGATTEEIRSKIAEMGIAKGTAKWQEVYKKAHIAAGYEWNEGEGFVKKA